MTIDSLSEIVSTSLSIPDLSKLTATDREKSQGHKKAVASLIPYVGGAAAEELQQYYDYKDDEFFRKFVGYLNRGQGTGDRYLSQASFSVSYIKMPLFQQKRGASCINKQRFAIAA